MMTRCYSAKLHEKHPQYSVCEVDEAWHDFQIFAEWYENHEFSGLGYHLDKDLLIPKNNIYSEKNCCLLPQELNKLITMRRRETGRLHGAIWSNSAKVWVAVLTIKGKQNHLGSFSNEREAHLTYVKAKESAVRSAAAEWRKSIEERAYKALAEWTCGFATETTRS